MHPLESTANFSAALILLSVRATAHGAMNRHDGHDGPVGNGGYFHQMHRAHFECNYGDNKVPLGWLFGTFDDGSTFKSKQAKAE